MGTLARFRGEGGGGGEGEINLRDRRPRGWIPAGHRRGRVELLGHNDIEDH